MQRMSEQAFFPPADLGESYDELGADELADLLRLVRSTRQAWGQLEAVLESELGRKVPAGQHVTTAGKPYQVRKGATSYEWDSADLWRAIVARAADERIVDAETGEYEREGEAVARVLRSCLGATPNWTTTGIRALGLDPSDYRTARGGRTSVQL